MKYISNILAAVAIACSVSACYEDNWTNIHNGELPDGEMSVNLQLNIPAVNPATRSMVPGEEKAVDNLKMVCFDANGYYLGVREAVVSQTQTDPDHGNITGAVPAATCRVHFIANRPSLDLSNVAIGTSENILMQSEEMTTSYDETDAQYISYWGYHREESVSNMQEWIDGKRRNDHIVYLLRDRAQVRIAAVSDAEQINVDRIYSVEWTITNGRDRGYIAPFDPSNVRNPFDGYYDVANNKATSVITEYASSGRYTSTENGEQMFSKNGRIIVGQENALKPIYLFEDYNEDANMHRVNSDVVKLILKVTYLYNDQGNEYATGVDRDVKYHTILLMNQEYTMFHVTRNHTYSLTIAGLPRNLGVDTYEEALENTNYSNNQLTAINEEATDVTDGTHSLSIQTATGTSVVYTETGTVTIPFLYFTNGAGDTSLSASNFSAVWKLNEDIAETSIPVTYNSSTGEGEITLTLKEVESTLKSGKLLFTDKAYGLQRYVNVYTISEYAFRETPTLEKVGTRTASVGGTSKSRDVYKLTLKLPAGTNRYPSGLYPITVKFTTQTLSTFSDNSATTTTEGLCGLTMSSTAIDGITDGTATGNNYPWNYNARSWGYWYSYIIQTQTDMTNEGTEENPLDVITLYFDDIRSDAHPNSTFTSVGLYLQIQHFGGVKAYYISV